jgi:hypothetical protein
MSEGFPYKTVIFIQIVVALIAVAAGASAGWLLGRKDYETAQFQKLGMSADDMLSRLKKVEKDYADLYDRCQPLEGSEKQMLDEAQTKVESLKTEIQAKEVEVARLEKKAKENVVLKKELDAKKAELVDLRSKLEVAEKEKADLEQKLQVAVQETSAARSERDMARGETIDVKWNEFKAQAALAICEKGNRKKLGNCREAVAATMTPERETRFRECISKKQAVPQLRELEKDQKLPTFAEWLNKDSKFTKGWYVLFCDPTLPEAGG